MPLIADAAISELPKPAEPMTAIPPEKLGTSVIVAPAAGEAGLQLSPFAWGVESTVNVAAVLVTVPVALLTFTV
jgi:hypothetical protein